MLQDFGCGHILLQTALCNQKLLCNAQNLATQTDIHCHTALHILSSFWFSASSDSLMRGLKRTGTFLPLFPTIAILTKCLHSFSSSGVSAKLTSPCVSDASIDRYDNSSILDTSPPLQRLNSTLSVSITFASAFQFAGDECSFRSFKCCCCFSARWNEAFEYLE